MDGFRDFLVTDTAHVPLPAFLLNVALAAVLAFVLGKVYVRYGNALSNRQRFSRNFMVLAVTTALIITIVKSSLALSLGLVGALSIVRFRAAIKDPEELTYLFLVIALGLGFGANQTLVTVTGFLIALIIIRLVATARERDEGQSFYLTVMERASEKADLGSIVGVLSAHCASVSLSRVDESSDSLDAAFLVEIEDFERLQAAKQELLALSPGMQIRFLDQGARLGGDQA